MTATVLLTGSTDGIGLLTARRLVADGHRVLLHGRNADKLERVRAELSGRGADVDAFVADLSRLPDVDALADAVVARHPRIDVLINNAGVFKTSTPRTEAGLDTRFVVNTIAPARLTRRLLPAIAPTGRIVNLSSAAQAPVDLEALAGRRQLDDLAAYAQSKLALTMWSAALAAELGPDGPVVIAVNPGSLLNTRMVREGFGQSRAGADVGADILARASFSEAFASASGRYFDNDAGDFAPPHPDARNPAKCAAVAQAVETLGAQDGDR